MGEGGRDRGGNDHTVTPAIAHVRQLRQLCIYAKCTMCMATMLTVLYIHAICAHRGLTLTRIVRKGEVLVGVIHHQPRPRPLTQLRGPLTLLF